MDHKEYVGSLSITPKDLRLFPEYTRGPLDRDSLLRRRFNWLCRVIPGTPSNHFRVWAQVEDFLLAEWETTQKQKMDLRTFQSRSCIFPFMMARAEVTNFLFYITLRDQLRILPYTRPSVLFLGPTFGGEIESIYAAGCIPWFETAWRCRWAAVAEERLVHDLVTYENFDKSNSPFPIVVISSWSPDPVKDVRRGYDALGNTGYILFPGTMKMVDEVKALGLRNETRNKDLAVWHKHDALPPKIGA